MTALGAVSEIEISADQVRPVLTLVEYLNELERSELIELAARMKNALTTATSPKEAERRADTIFVSASPGLLSKVGDALDWTKKHAWTERTWAQRLAIVSLIPTLPLAVTKGAGLAIAGTAFRVRFQS